MKFGSLFAGIGGFDLGFERAGLESSWQVEIDDYATRVLEKHWPNVRRWRDVRDFPPEPVDDWRVDIICGGFPCQDISAAGKKAGINGERSGLWSEYVRIIRVLRPRIVVVENVADLLVRGFDRVLGDLATLGFDAEWDVLPASAFGAPHRRERLFLVAYSDEERRNGRPRVFGETGRHELENCRPLLQDSDSIAVGAWWQWRRVAQAGCPEWWPVEPDVGRVAYGVPDRLDRLATLGNSIVPQIAEFIGRRIINASNQ